MKKILYIENVATVKATNFYTAALEACKQMGWEFHLAYNCLDYTEEAIGELEKEMGLHFHQIDFVRNPIHPANIRALIQLNKLVKDEHFDLIHCNTPIGGVLGRIVAKKQKVQRVIYQAHGFHFYTGAPIINWLLYYPIEKILAKYTDDIITINQDDYHFAQQHLNPRSKVYYVSGVGIDKESLTYGKNIRKELNFQENDFIILVVGRLEKNKNCQTIIEAVKRVPNVKLIFCGDGKERNNLEKRSAVLGDRVVFLGNRNDMPNIYSSVDCFVLASFREGLSRSIMEAMANGLPCIVSDIRGNRDLIDFNGGVLFKPQDINSLANAIRSVYGSKEMRNKMKLHNLQKIDQFTLACVVKDLYKIYTKQG